MDRHAGMLGLEVVARTTAFLGSTVPIFPQVALGGGPGRGLVEHVCVVALSESGEGTKARATSIASRWLTTDEKSISAANTTE